MMDDLISRQAAIDIMKAFLHNEDDWFQEAAASRLRMLPAEIVHCKECVYYENENHGLCDLGGEWAPDDYCSYGRRYKHG